jgi:hypothetical protein
MSAMLYCTVLYVQSHHIGESYFDSTVSTVRLPPYPDNYGYCWTRQSQCSFSYIVSSAASQLSARVTGTNGN